MTVSNEEVLRYYSRKDVQRAILKLSKNREISAKFGDKGFSKRPDVILYENDIMEFVKQGATSFHFSEERWSDPMNLRSGMSRKELDENRLGFDCIIDVDSEFIEFSKIATKLIIQALNFLNIRTIGVKFSGNKGFHICVPFESFPEKVNDIYTKLLFPEAPRYIAEYLKYLIKEYLTVNILEKSSIEEMSSSLKKDKAELLVDRQFNPYSVVELDTIFISSRHMFRAPYSLHESSGLVSIPISVTHLDNFNISSAKINNIKFDEEFVKIPKEQEATQLIVQAFDHIKKTEKKDTEIKKSENFENIDVKIPDSLFPPCINKILNGLPTDGRKRAVFILINFFKHMNYSIDEIESILLEWNKKNYEPLKEGYIKSQISWHKRQNQRILPPNCSNTMYYAGIGCKCEDNICNRYKNPVNYAISKYKESIRKPMKKSKRKELKYI